MDLAITIPVELSRQRAPRQLQSSHLPRNIPQKKRVLSDQHQVPSSCSSRGAQGRGFGGRFGIFGASLGVPVRSLSLRMFTKEGQGKFH